jgi:hypothetical protein
MGSCAGGGGGGGLGGRLDSLAPNGPAMESALQAPSAARAARAKNRIDRDVARRMGGNLRNGLVATFRGCSLFLTNGRQECRPEAKSRKSDLLE